MKNTIPEKKFSWKMTILLTIGAGVFAVSLSVFIQTRAQIVHAYVASYVPEVSYSATVVRGPGSSHEEPGIPVRLVIPAIGVDAHIQSVGLSWRGNGDMGVPTNFTDVGWYNGGVRPGMPGNAVIDGHLDGKNVAQAVFYNLRNLKPGDVVNVVDTKNITYRYRVVDTKIYDYAAPADDVFIGDSSKSRLNLITCGGVWNKSEKLYDKRVVVFTELITD